MRTPRARSASDAAGLVGRHSQSRRHCAKFEERRYHLPAGVRRLPQGAQGLHGYPLRVSSTLLPASIGDNFSCVRLTNGDCFRFRNDLDILEKIPILPALRSQALGLTSTDDNDNKQQKQQQQQLDEEDEDEDEDVEVDTTENATDTAIELIQESSPETAEAYNLLKWISAKDQTSLEQMSDMCERGLEQFNERILETLKTEVFFFYPFLVEFFLLQLRLKYPCFFMFRSTTH